MHIKRHRILLLVAVILCLFLSIFGVIISFVSIMNRTTKSGIFEDVLITLSNFFMVAIAVFVLINTITSFKKGSTFMKELTLDSRKHVKRKSVIIFFIIGLIGLISFLVFTLMFSNVIINTVFPKALDAAMMSFSFIIFVMGISFSSYPYVFSKDLKGNNV